MVAVAKYLKRSKGLLVAAKSHHEKYPRDAVDLKNNFFTKRGLMNILSTSPTSSSEPLLPPVAAPSLSLVDSGVEISAPHTEGPPFSFGATYKFLVTVLGTLKTPIDLKTELKTCIKRGFTFPPSNFEGSYSAAELGVRDQELPQSLFERMGEFLHIVSEDVRSAYVLHHQNTQRIASAPIKKSRTMATAPKSAGSTAKKPQTPTADTAKEPANKKLKETPGAPVKPKRSPIAKARRKLDIEEDHVVAHLEDFPDPVAIQPQTEQPPNASWIDNISSYWEREDGTVVMYYKNKTVYMGEVLNGKRHGYGVWVLSNGIDTKTGFWANDFFMKPTTNEKPFKPVSIEDLKKKYLN